ncbi:hypothetical protein ABFS83_04G155500 [Erythranthe nasuta]
MAAYAALVSVLTIIDQIQNHPRLSISFDMNQLESLGEKVGFLLDFVENDTHGVVSNQVEVLESQIASAAYAAEDVIESHVVDQIQLGRKKVVNNIMTRVAKIMHRMRLKKFINEDEIATGSIPMLELQKVMEDMDSIKKKVLELKDEIGSNNDMQLTSTTSSTPLITTNKNTMVGFDEQLLQLLDKLTGQRSNRQIIPIVGMGGIGKTTLAKIACEHSLIVHHFDIRTWVTVSQNYNVRELFVQLLSWPSKPDSELYRETEEQLGEKLHKKLWVRRYLIVVDDIWSLAAWDRINILFPDNNNGSRIVVTTRISDVAFHFDSSFIKLNFLDEDKSWKLFCEKAFGQVGCPSELEDLRKEIVKKCKGLPLAISVIGGLLGRSHMRQEYWKDIAKDIPSILNSGENMNCSSILSLSYTYLPPHLKPCFLYMGIFPEDEEIRVSQLIKLWVAEGFISSNKSQSLEEIARGYLNDLIGRNLILKHMLGSNGRIKICKIHDLLRDLCLEVAQKEEFICVMEEKPRGTERGRRIVFSEKILHATYESRVLHTLQLGSLTRTWVTSIDGRLSNNRLLRVMSCNNGHKKEYLRRHIVDQVNMRYLAYNDESKILFACVKLPSSIAALWNLQTIIISGKIKVPLQIWEMRQLRHLDIFSLFLPVPPRSCDKQHDEIVLQNLQTLKKVVNFVWSEEACKRVPNVRKLNIYADSSNDYSLYNVSHLHKLESLQCLLLGQDNMLQKLTFPCSLKKLSLSYGNSLWEDLTVIGSLPCLEVLKLSMNSVKGTMWNPVEGDFRRLKFLSIYWCGLVYWNAGSSHFPVLEKLVLELMLELDEIPVEIGEIPTLEFIHVTRCTESAAVSAMKIAEEQEDACNEGLQVRVVIDGKDELESFQEKMKQSEDDDISFTRYNFQVTIF